LIKPNGGSFTSRDIDIFSCIINGCSAKSTGKLLGISRHTASNYIGNIRLALNFGSQDQIVRFVEESGKYRKVNERYVDLLLFSKFEETLEKIKTLKKISQKYKCVMHIAMEDVGKCILLNYLRLAGIEIGILYDSKNYADDKFHIICCSENSKINLENLNVDNIVVSENHCSNMINLRGQCIESKESETQYKAYFSLLGCISKIYSSKNVDDILNEFKEYYYSMKDGISSTNLERSQIEITDKRKTKYVMLSFITFITLSIASVTMYFLYTHRHETHKAILTNINILIGQDVFLKRKDLISEMDKILEKQTGVKLLILVGQGGMGKTTLARHYVHKYR
jgi:DNA-binding CsgD family transcriptional regulator